MESNILKSTKKMLGLADNYTAFDHEIILFINTAFSTLNQLIGSTVAPIEDSTNWETLELEEDALSLVKIYVYLKVRMLFDPPATSFLIEAIEKQVREHEWRLVAFHDTTAATTYADLIEEEVV